MNRLAKEEGNLRPSPPQHAKHRLHDRECEEHVRGMEKMLDEEFDREYGDKREYQAWDEREDNQEESSPKRDFGLGCR